MDDKKKNYKYILKKRFQDFANEENRRKAFEWLKKNLNKVKQLISDTQISKFILEPFLGVFKTKSDIVESDHNAETKLSLSRNIVSQKPEAITISGPKSIGGEYFEYKYR